MKSFIYNVSKADVFSNLSEAKLVALAECHLTDIAASRMMRTEEEGRKPSSITELQDAMMKEFVPPDEKARAQLELMDLKMKESMNIHIARFKKLAEITSVPLKEAYMLFFMSMPAKYKQELHKKYPTGSPPTDVEMSDVYEHARTLAVAMQWISGKRSYGSVSGNGKVKNGNGQDTQAENLRQVLIRDSPERGKLRSRRMILSRVGVLNNLEKRICI